MNRGVHAHMTGKEFRADQAKCRTRTRIQFDLGTLTDGRIYRVITHPVYRNGIVVDHAVQIVRRWPKERGKKARRADKLARRRAA